MGSLLFISIHLMLLFNRLWSIVVVPIYQISIHLMLLFNTSLHSKSTAIIKISIHLMLLFNYTANSVYTVVAVISIHLMLLFNLFNVDYSTVAQNYFNTSNVTIQPTILSHLFYSQFHYTHYISTFS